VTTVNEIIQQYGAAYRAKYGEKLLPSHQRALRDLELCRTAALGGHVYECPTCREQEYAYHSCRNRHCPQCQGQAGEEWLMRQQQMLLPTPYFMVTFTLPEPLRALARSQQRVLYNLLFRSAAAALQELAADPRFVGGQIGLVGILHTWSRAMVYHPHVHFLTPGGGLSAAGQVWKASRRGFLVHVRPLSKLFRAKFRAGLKQAGLLNQVPAAVWRQAWVVHSKAVGTGQAALKYLAPYIFRVAISNNRIVNVAEGQVTFRYRPSGQKKSKLCSLPAEEFIRRFLQHVLPQRFVKVRYYGLFAAGQRPRLQQARALLARLEPASETAEVEADPVRVEPKPERVCPRCGRPMTKRRLPPEQCKPP
jgi:Putative transposase/Transposase zinc-binding domain